MKLKKISGILLAVFLSGAPSPNLYAAGKIRITATTSTFANIASEVAGEKAEIYAVASPKRDIHYISPTPKDVMKVRKADVFIHGGLDLETWRGPLLDAAGKPELMWPAGQRQIDVSAGIELLGIPASLSRIEGDIHAYGNPHYWTDPENAKIIARNIAEGLARLYPADADYFRSNEKAFSERLGQKIQEWQELLAPYAGQKVLTYHRSWPYFLKRFGLVNAGEIQPKPGIPPTARHLSEIKRMMKEDHVKIIIKENYFESHTPKKIAQDTGAVVLDFVQSVGENAEVPDYEAMTDFNVRRLATAFQEVAHE